MNNIEICLHKIIVEQNKEGRAKSFKATLTSYKDCSECEGHDKVCEKYYPTNERK